ncbi:hypothetical protein [Azospirillum largimobile]
MATCEATSHLKRPIQTYASAPVNGADVQVGLYAFGAS